MKKLLSMAVVASAALVLASCSNDEPVQVNNGRAISFRSHISRASETHNGNLSSFNATALYKDGTETVHYFDDVTFSKNGTASVFTSENPIYWPSASSLYFIAYSPDTLIQDGVDGGASGTLGWSGNNKMLIDFSPATAFANQYDFVTALTTATRSSAATNGVNLTFHHHLSQIEIKAKSTNTNYTFKVKGVKIGDVASTNTFNFNADEWVKPLFSGSTNYSAEWHSAIQLGSEPISLMDSTGNAMLLPQTTTAWKPNPGSSEVHSDDTGSFISVLLQITKKNENGNPTQFYPFASQKDQNGKVKEYAWAAVPVAFHWIEGCKYIYVLDFTNGAGYVDKDDDDNPDEPILQPIRFTVNVQSWGELWVGE